MQYEYVIKSRILTSTPRVKGVYVHTICDNVAALVFPFCYMQHDHVLKTFKFDLLTSRVGGGGGGVVGNISGTMLLHL